MKRTDMDKVGEREVKLFGELGVHEPTEFTDSTLGVSREAAAGTLTTTIAIGGCTSLASDCSRICESIRQSCSTTDHARDNRHKHPTWRACVYRRAYWAEASHLGEDEAALFLCRRDNHVAAGHDGWLCDRAVVERRRPIGTAAAVGTSSIVCKDIPLRHRRQQCGTPDPAPDGRGDADGPSLVGLAARTACSRPAQPQQPGCSQLCL